MKPRRDITLGEMQDECLKHKMCEGCPYAEWCGANSADGWDLTDPPRFNEQQMTFWRGWYAVGARWAESRKGTPVTYINGENDMQLGVCIIGDIAQAITKNGETRIDLAELLGKDAI